MRLDRGGKIVLSYVPNDETAETRVFENPKPTMKRQTRCTVHSPGPLGGRVARCLHASRRLLLVGIAHSLT